jgi:hypothetical protein
MDQLEQVALTMCMSKAALAYGTTSTLTTTGTTTFCIKGKAYTKAAITNLATPTTDAATGLAFPPLVANQGTVIVVGYDSGGNLKACQGTIQGLDVGGLFIQAPLLPNVPDTMCPIGYFTVLAGSTAVGSWVFGTNNLSAVTGLTFTTPQDVVTLPFRPQIA